MSDPVEANTSYLLRGTLLPRSHNSHTTLILTSTASATFDPRINTNNFSQRAYISSVGRVTECHFSHQEHRWIVRARHRDYDPILTTVYQDRNIVNFDVEYTLQRATMREIGLELFAIGNILGFNGRIFGYDQGHGRWIIHLTEAEPMQPWALEFNV
ncbi:uncharacterized protein MELLADRAFT_103064 [Melampsora larici-populina 98AG31]|uniref:Uncharacterized protein n=1 Tax=Melampsora larici-populina (strain 98AG31 / pathotype 3-4-7) TaxID=747676 RepID=F4RAF2_MELLP|nr:uncharacterized protein MELLADRAFT_103064 [Melampsora larici-populina 98AG31]EGG10470.1 hypothetical protein MELLADRAFT_103064 [Melampsora larici-populina 98AG31]